jgi:hypothetical protein
MKIETSNNTLTIQLRYCFEDENLHSMNAEVFNECEKQFIKAIKSTEKYFEDTLQVKIRPREDGSLIDVFTIAINNPAIVATFTTLITIFAAKFFDFKFSSAKHKTDETNIKLENLKSIKEQIKAGTLTEEEFDYIASNDKDLRKLKSVFFKTAKKEPNIVKVEAKTISDTHSHPIIIIVERQEFDHFIIPEITEKEENTQPAKIYIVSPILVQGKKSPAWRGIFNDEPIEFRLTDKDFLQQVYGKGVKFSNGTFINGDLKTTIITNIETDETKMSREVTIVNNYGEDDQQIRKIAHKQKSKKRNTIQQIPLPSLFDTLE